MIMNMKIIYGSAGIIMLLAAIEDIRSKKISQKKLIVLGMICVIGCFAVKQDWWSMIGGAAIGLCMIGISMISKEQIGWGDGAVTGLLGVMLGTKQCLVMLCLASCIMTVVSILILLSKKGNRNTRLPFVPALFGGYLAVLIM